MSTRKISRRSFLKSAAAAGGALAASRFLDKFPLVKAQGELPDLSGVRLTVLNNSSFIPGWDDFFRSQVEEDFMRRTGAEVTMEFLAENQLTEQIAAASQAGAGPDIIMSAHNWAHVYQEALVDLSDIAEEIKEWVGEFYPQIESYTNVEGRYLTIPHHFLGIGMHYRRSWLEEVGGWPPPQTYEELFDVGKRLKENGHPLGTSLGHSINDPHLWCYPMLWAYGGKEIDQEGNVAINSPETVEALRVMAQAWGDAFDESGLAWDDSGNNRAFLSGTVSAVLNATSIWWVARQDELDFFDDIVLDLYPMGPNGRFSQGVVWSYGVMSYSENVEAAKAFIKWSMTDEIWMPGFELAESFHNGVGEIQNNNPLWENFPPVTHVLKDAPVGSQGIGYEGPPTRAAGLAKEQFIIVDMFARAVQGEDPEELAAWAEGELQRIYGQEEEDE